MRAITFRRVGAGAIVAAVAAAGVTTAASGKPYDTPSGGAATIKIVGKKKTLRFSGPKTIKKGAKLTILNTLDPKGDGPHTFTLIESKLSKQAQKQCASKKGSDLCNALIGAHKVEFISQNDIRVHKKKVDNGKTGWDTAFTNDGKTAGDSYYTDEQDQSTTRKVTAAVGTKLHYFCVVHPFMQGSITVTK
ncbi:MAG: hypothetical protein QOF76_1537 [Solirubrobacteraceae bacterium]|jgi:hypothetical protein|nr:hypothetical protein [Solirubrobacteraceae bacterium]